MKTAFTMIELIFVVVILGILAAVAIPKLSATRDDAKVAKIIQSISLAVSEIASYAVAQGKVEENLSMMSYAVSYLVDSNDAILDISNSAVDFKMGGTSNCIRMQVDEDAGDANLTLIENSTTDSLCAQLQSVFDPKNYNIYLTGGRIAN
jgi:prepilin-type N-terminal cleavage/methylation domain-containing protein